MELSKRARSISRVLGAVLARRCYKAKCFRREPPPPCQRLRNRWQRRHVDAPNRTEFWCVYPLRYGMKLVCVNVLTDRYGSQGLPRWVISTQASNFTPEAATTRPFRAVKPCSKVKVASNRMLDWAPACHRSLGSNLTAYTCPLLASLENDSSEAATTTAFRQFRCCKKLAWRSCMPLKSAHERLNVLQPDAPMASTPSLGSFTRTRLPKQRRQQQPHASGLETV
ncbi:hypothetical protein BU16DRAFT_151016 [Lophium mytilinum]|uniref:Uncharacterized protein n=1 Tax=Lophium mytilinum TaxID=390894 RepID=A0A6A6QDA0_9PEZI|nr:hypothetical protein BU16DRAFT_151016 [Lophium mytilinum]